MFEWTLSRYLIPPFFSVLLAVGATIGVGCLLMVLSLFENYYLSTEKVFMGIHPQIEIRKADMQAEEAQTVIQLLRVRYPNITAIGPALYEQLHINIAEVKARLAICVQNSTTAACFNGASRQETVPPESIVTKRGFDVLQREVREVDLRGIRVEDQKTVMHLKEIVNGSTDLERLNQVKNLNGHPIPLAFYMEGLRADAILDDYLLRAARSERPEEHFRLVGMLDLGRKRGSLPLLVMSLENAQKLLGRPHASNTIEIALKEPYQSAQMASDIQQLLGDAFTVTSWTEKEQASFAFLRITKMMAFALIFSISIVAAISVYSALLLSVLRNRAKIAVFKALGIKDRSIYLIFISSALVIGLVGIVMGTGLGYAGSEWLIAHFADSLKKVGLDDPQTQIGYGDLAITTFAALMLFFVTAIVPAKRATAIDPIDNLQR